MSLATDLLADEIAADRRRLTKIAGELVKLELEAGTLRDIAESLASRIDKNERKIQELGGVVPGLSGQLASTPSVPTSFVPDPRAVAMNGPASIAMRAADPLNYVIAGTPEARLAPPGTPVLIGPPPDLPLSHMRHEFTTPPAHGTPNKPGDPLPTGAVHPQADPLITTDMQYTDPETKEEQEGI